MKLPLTWFYLPNAQRLSQAALRVGYSPDEVVMAPSVVPSFCSRSVLEHLPLPELERFGPRRGANYSEIGTTLTDVFTVQTWLSFDPPQHIEKRFTSSLSRTSPLFPATLLNPTLRLQRQQFIPFPLHTAPHRMQLSSTSTFTPSRCSHFWA